MTTLLHKSRTRGLAIRRGEVLLPWAETALREIVHIAQAISGRGDYYCPACRQNLIARKGALNAHHFAHENGSICAYALETALHRWAKQMLPAAGRFLLPELRVATRRRSVIVHPAADFAYDTIQLEHRLSPVVPDIVFGNTQGERLLVEIAVTHRCDGVKLEALSRIGLPTVEIDLSGYDVPNDPDVLVDDVLWGAGREWVFHPDQAKALAELVAEEELTRRLQEHARAREREARQRLLATERSIGRQRLQAEIAEQEGSLGALRNADAREAFLLREAEATLPGHGLSWLTFPHVKLEGTTPRAQARSSPLGLKKALAALAAPLA